VKLTTSFIVIIYDQSGVFDVKFDHDYSPLYKRKKVLLGQKCETIFFNSRFEVVLKEGNPSLTGDVFLFILEHCDCWIESGQNSQPHVHSYL
jgi:hypothetical protein